MAICQIEFKFCLCADKLQYKNLQVCRILISKNSL